MASPTDIEGAKQGEIAEPCARFPSCGFRRRRGNRTVPGQASINSYAIRWDCGGREHREKGHSPDRPERRAFRKLEEADSVVSKALLLVVPLPAHRGCCPPPYSSLIVWRAGSDRARPYRGGIPVSVRACCETRAGGSPDGRLSLRSTAELEFETEDGLQHAVRDLRAGVWRKRAERPPIVGAPRSRIPVLVSEDVSQ